MCKTGFCDLYTVRSLSEDGEVLSTEIVEYHEALPTLNAKVKEYLNAPVSCSGCVVQIINSTDDVITETRID